MIFVIDKMNEEEMGKTI